MLRRLDKPPPAPTPSTTAPPTNSATCPGRTPNFEWSPLDLGVGGLSSPNIDGYVKTSNDGVGDGPIANLAWGGVEYAGFAKIPMYNGGKNNDNNTPVIGQAWLGYDCTDNILCIAAYLSEAYFEGPSGCSAVVSDADSWVRFTDDNGYDKLKQSSDPTKTKFKYVNYPNDSGKPIGE